MSAAQTRRYLFSSARDQALVQPQRLPLGEALCLVVPHQCALNLCSREEEESRQYKLPTKT